MSSTFAATEKADCASREVRQRLRVYRRLVAEGRMSQEKADDEIAIMQAIADDYRALAMSEEPTLFTKKTPLPFPDKD